MNAGLAHRSQNVQYTHLNNGQGHCAQRGSDQTELLIVLAGSSGPRKFIASCVEPDHTVWITIQIWVIAI